jgi:cobalamin biosynthesis Mg chelatase CobN
LSLRVRLWRKAFLSKSGSSDADADAPEAGGEASQRTEEGGRRWRRPPTREEEEEEEEEEAAAGERSAERSCVVMVAIAGVGLVAGVAWGAQH